MQSLNFEKRVMPQRGVVSVSALCRLQEIQVVGVLRDNCLLEPCEDRVEGHCKKKTARWTA